MAVATKRQSDMKSYLNIGYDVMKYFAKFEKFIPHSIIMPSFMTIGSQMPWGLECTVRPPTGPGQSTGGGSGGKAPKSIENIKF